MRKLLIGCLVAVAALGITAVALAVTVQNYKQTFSSKKPGKPSGSVFHANSNDSANTSNNQQPAAAKEVDIIFPKGSAVDQKAIPTCSASDQDFSSKGQAACPSKSQIGHQKPKCHASGAQANCSGHASLRLRFGNKGSAADIAARIYAFNGKNKTLILYIVPNGANPIVLRPKIKTGKTPKIITKIPGICTLPPTGQSYPNCGAAGEARLDDLDLTIDKLGSKTKPYLKTPPTCPSSKKWVFKATWHYRPATSGEPPQPASDTKTSNSPCK